MKTPQLSSCLFTPLMSLMFLAGAALPAGEKADPAERQAAPAYAGTFRDDRVTLQLQPTPGQASRFTGSIRLGPDTLPVMADERDGMLRGSFESQGDRFDFSAKFEGNVLVFLTEGTTYRLRRRAVNPLAQSKVDGTPVEGAIGATASAPLAQGQSKARTGGPIRLKKVSVMDDGEMIGGEACSLLIPEDWKLEGGVKWRLHPALPAYLAFKVHNPSGMEVLEVLPTIPCVWTQGGIAFFPPGSSYLGNEVAEPVEDPVLFVERFVLPRFRQNLTRAKTVATEQLPKLAEAVLAASAEPGVRKTGQAARVRLEYEEQGKTFEEDIYCVVVLTSVPQIQTTFWGPERVYSFKAAKGKLDERAGLFHSIGASAKVNLQWMNKYLQLVQILVQNQLQAIRRTGELSRYIARTSDEISEIRRSAWENQQRAQDRISENFSQYIRGADEYHNPFESRSVELPSGYREVWANPQGEYLLSDDVTFNPNVGDTRTWQRLEKKE